MSTREASNVVTIALGWSRFEWQLKLFNDGMEYIERTIGTKERQKQISETRSFWMWWQSGRHVNDHQFCQRWNLDRELASKLDKSVQFELRQEYEAEMSPERHRTLIGDGTMRAIKAEIKGLTKINKNGH